MSSLRKCTECGKEAHTEDQLELFTKSKKSKYGRENLCKECCSTNNKEWRKRNKEKASLYKKKCHIRDRYGITLEEYEACMETSVVCEVCGTTEDLCYDHDHNTMEFRGVLCSKCNRSIGQLGDTLESLERATKYLRKHYE
jgi:hypothetical protein